MVDTWYFDYTTKTGLSITVEAASDEDIWVFHNGKIMKWHLLSQEDQDSIRDLVTEHFFMEEANEKASAR